MPNTTPASYMVQVSDIKQLFKISEAMAGTLTKKRTDFIPSPQKKDEPPTNQKFGK
jgi:hypothetical protein